MSIKRTCPISSPISLVIWLGTAHIVEGWHQSLHIIISGKRRGGAFLEVSVVAQGPPIRICDRSRSWIPIQNRRSKIRKLTCLHSSTERTIVSLIPTLSLYNQGS